MGRAFVDGLREFPYKNFKSVEFSLCILASMLREIFCQKMVTKLKCRTSTMEPII